ncbi:MAG: hypothetical protein A2Z25_00720 [Planctomycetes bacterium RBG_16_55_9]|nr:MAG: hypothetical protein A2Z25_00720 [Planctomycetes bacterium RBG_16_55_9]
MAKLDVSKKGAGKIEHLKRALDWTEIYKLFASLIENAVKYSWSSSRSRVVLYELGRSPSDETQVAGSGHDLWVMRAYLRDVEDRLAQLETVNFENRIQFRKLEDRFGIVNGIEQEAEQDWPKFASGEFAKLAENMKGLEDSGDDKELILYHIMEIEALLGKVERKARATNHEYEARLAASLRDICKIHEPSELSERQIERFAASLQALIEGWGELNREKVKWVRGKLLEVGLTWLPVTEKALNVIDEAKSSVE